MEEAIVISNPEGISYARLAALKGRVKLEKVGMKFRGPSVRKLLAKEFGLKQNATYDQVIAAAEEKMQEYLQNQADATVLKCTPEQCTALKKWATEHGPKWKDKLLKAWSDRTEVGPLLHQLHNTHGPLWLSCVVINVSEVTK